MMIFNHDFKKLKEKLMRQSKVVLSVICLLFGLLGGLAFGQERFGGLNGVAADQTGAVLPGITVTVTHKETDRVLTATTGTDGSYLLRNIEPGRYAVKFEREGFSVTEYPDVVVLVGQNLKLDPRMQVGGVQTAIEVTDVVPLLDTQSSLVAHNVPAEEFDRLPKTRTFQYLAITAPAVNTGELEGGIQVNGASGAENIFNIDGLSVNSVIHGHSRQNAGFEYLQEVQIKTAGIDAEYGGTLGGVITAVTKSGGNEFHGEGHFYYWGSALNASPVKRFVLDPQNDTTVSYVRDDKNKERNYEPGFSFGGPIRADKLYFFSAWSPRWRFEDQIARLSSGTDTDTFTRDQRYMSGFNKISFDPTPQLRSNFTFLWTPTKSDGSLLVFNGTGPNWSNQNAASQQSRKTTGYFSPQSNYSGNIDFLLNNHVLISARGGRFWDNFKSLGVPDFSSVLYRTSAVGLPGVPPNLQQGVLFTNSPAIQSIKHDLTTHTNAQLDAAVSGNWGGFHNLKTGFGLQKNVNNVDISYGGGGYVEVYWNSTFNASPTGIPDRGQYGYYRVVQVGTVGSVGSGIKSLYVQDQWTVHPRLTLDLGIRSEQERIPSFRRDIRDTAIDFGWKDKIAPRLGASWDVSGDGNAKLYGSYGRYYDWTKYEMVRGQFGGNVQRLWFRSLDTTDVFSLSFANKPGRDLWLRTGDSFRDDRIPSFERIDPNLKPMAQDQFVIGFSQQLNTQTVLGARYVRNSLVRTIEDLGNLVDGSSVFTMTNPGEGLGARLLSPDTATPAFDYPKAVRQYDAVELTLARRLSSGWFGNVNYTWSRLYGNYPGVANSDEFRTPATGGAFALAQQQGTSMHRPGNNASIAFDSDEMLFDSQGTLDVQGRLATDRPHVFKLNGGYEKGWGAFGSTDIGTLLYVGSGTPLSTEVYTIHNHPAYVNGRGDMGRTPVLSYTDLSIGHTFSVREGQNLRFELNMLNAFNQKTARHRFVGLNRGVGGTRASSAINLNNTNLFNGYDYRAMIAATPDGQNAFDPRYGLDDLFSSGFAGRFGVKFTF